VTPAQLRARLLTLLAAQLGTYKTTNGSTTPAIYVGEPPSDWRATGLEVRIEPLPELDLAFVHQGVGVGLQHRVTLIPRNATHASTAVQRVVRAFDTTTPRTIPANEALGVLQQYTLTIRS
jgi:hypothetical protein